MILDSSAVIAILQGEAERQAFLQAIIRDERRIMAAPTLLETSMVLASRILGDALPGLDEFLERTKIAIIPFTADHAAAARQAFLRYGKGRHPAGLNFGDCIAYATAKIEREPLLFKGSDFRLTDIEAAL